MKKVLGSLVIAVLLAVILSGEVFAVTLNVPASYPTIQAAVDASSRGATILVAPGEYVENITMKPWVTITSVEGPKVTTIRSVKAWDYVVVGASNAAISGFTITGGEYGIHISRASMTITNNIITSNRIGVYAEYSSPKITGNIISGSEQGIHNWFSSPIITNNIIVSSEHGIVNWYSSPTITNNIITGTRECGITMGGSDEYPMITYNNIWDNATDFCNLFGANPTVANNISADPMFIDPTAGNYHLQSGSPCIDEGSNAALGLIATDFDGNPRIADGNGDGVAIVDIGAYEFQSFIPRTIEDTFAVIQLLLASGEITSVATATSLTSVLNSALIAQHSG